MIGLTHWEEGSPSWCECSYRFKIHTGHTIGAQELPDVRNYLEFDGIGWPNVKTEL